MSGRFFDVRTERDRRQAKKLYTRYGVNEDDSVDVLKDAIFEKLRSVHSDKRSAGKQDKRWSDRRHAKYSTYAADLREVRRMATVLRDEEPGIAEFQHDVDAVDGFNEDERLSRVPLAIGSSLDEPYRQRGVRRRRGSTPPLQGLIAVPRLVDDVIDDVVPVVARVDRRRRRDDVGDEVRAAGRQRLRVGDVVDLMSRSSLRMPERVARRVVGNPILSGMSGVPISIASRRRVVDRPILSGMGDVVDSVLDMVDDPYVARRERGAALDRAAYADFVKRRDEAGAASRRDEFSRRRAAVVAARDAEMFPLRQALRDAMLRELRSAGVRGGQLLLEGPPDVDGDDLDNLLALRGRVDGGFVDDDLGDERAAVRDLPDVSVDDVEPPRLAGGHVGPSSYVQDDVHRKVLEDRRLRQKFLRRDLPNRVASGKQASIEYDADRGARLAAGDVKRRAGRVAGRNKKGGEREYEGGEGDAHPSWYEMVNGLAPNFRYGGAGAGYWACPSFPFMASVTKSLVPVQQYVPPGVTPSVACLAFELMRTYTLGVTQSPQSIGTIAGQVYDVPFSGGFVATDDTLLVPALIKLANPVNSIPEDSVWPFPGGGRDGRYVPMLALEVQGVFKFYDSLPVFQRTDVVRLMVVLDKNPKFVYGSDSTSFSQPGYQTFGVPICAYEDPFQDLFIDLSNCLGSMAFFLDPTNAKRFSILFDDITECRSEPILQTWTVGSHAYDYNQLSSLRPLALVDQNAKAAVKSMDWNPLTSLAPLALVDQNAKSSVSTLDYSVLTRLSKLETLDFNPASTVANVLSYTQETSVAGATNVSDWKSIGSASLTNPALTAIKTSIGTNTLDLGTGICNTGWTEVYGGVIAPPTPYVTPFPPQPCLPAAVIYQNKGLRDGQSGRPFDSYGATLASMFTRLVDLNLEVQSAPAMFVENNKSTHGFASCSLGTIAATVFTEAGASVGTFVLGMNLFGPSVAVNTVIQAAVSPGIWTVFPSQTVAASLIEGVGSLQTVHAGGTRIDDLVDLNNASTHGDASCTAGVIVGGLFTEAGAVSGTFVVGMNLFGPSVPPNVVIQASVAPLQWTVYPPVNVAASVIYGFGSLQTVHAGGTPIGELLTEADAVTKQPVFGVVDDAFPINVSLNLQGITTWYDDDRAPAVTQVVHPIVAATAPAGSIVLSTFTEGAGSSGTFVVGMFLGAVPSLAANTQILALVSPGVWTVSNVQTVSPAGGIFADDHEFTLSPKVPVITQNAIYVLAFTKYGRLNYSPFVVSVDTFTPDPSTTVPVGVQALFTASKTCLFYARA